MTAGRGRRVCAAFAAAAVGAAIAGCEPCAGVVSGCRTALVASANGRVIDFVSGRGVGGVLVEFHRTSGPGAAPDPMAARTDAEGLFAFSTGVDGGGSLVGDLRVTPSAADAPYTIPAVRLTPSRRRGAATVLPTLFARPWLYAIGELHVGRGGPPAAGATVTFTQTGGAPLAGGGFTLVTDEGGRFFYQAPGRGADPALGTYTVSGGNLPRTYRVPSLVPPLLAEVLPPQVTVYMELGASLEGVARFTTRTGAAVADAEVTFRRTGGVALQAETVSGRTNAGGDVYLAIRPAVDAPGAVLGEFTVRAADGRTRTVTGARIESVETGEYRSIGTYLVPDA